MESPGSISGLFPKNLNELFSRITVDPFALLGKC